MSPEKPAGGILTPAQIELLTSVQDRLIPREGVMPGAGEIGGAKVVDGYLAARPELRRGLLGSLQALEINARQLRLSAGAGAGDAGDFMVLAPDQRDEALRRLEASQPELFATLLRQTYNSYYTNPAVQKLIGEGAGPPQPKGYALPPFEEKLLESVRQRGKLWRDA